MHKFACFLLLLAACAVASGWAAPGADGVAAEQPSQEEIEARDDEASVSRTYRLQVVVFI